MSHPDPTGFGKFVPGFDFLQNLGKGAASALPAMEQWNQWVAPTLDVKALDKRIEELKAVQFWLDQNATALKATIQALEVQKLTLATLKGMNFNPADLARAWQPAAATAPAAKVPAQPAPAAKAPPKPAAKSRPAAAKTAANTAPDPMQFWGALTQQFQQIASKAMQDVASKAATATKTATKKEAPAATRARAAAPKAAAPKAAAKRPARRR